MKMDTLDEPQVLIVDDVPATRAMLRDMLLEMGFNDIIEAGDGKDALETLKNHRAQLIICDNAMVQMSGLDLLYQLRNHPYLVDIPFIVISSNDERDFIDAAFELGADDYLVKPINFKFFKRKVVDVLRRRTSSMG
jgi:two-component system chemotaxis response regulator CheY